MMTAESGNTVERRGHCLCGKVSITAKQASNQVFVDEKPDYYEFANKTKDFTGAEIFALFGSS